MVPSTATIQQIRKGGQPLDDATAVAVRKAMERAESTAFDFAHPHRSARRAMETIDGLVGGHGVEYIPAGSGNRSPSIRYVNLGDTYETTILYVRGRFRVGCWGDIVERGNYE
jgi:hypothetical protein